MEEGGGGKLSHDTLERVSYVLGIYKALQPLFSNPGQADAWMKKPSAAFGGQSALEHALGGRVVDVAHVRQYLDFIRG
ncbi:MAG: MbcA/ParS/Xre antitoxin family protein [Polyangiales bacterium]